MLIMLYVINLEVRILYLICLEYHLNSKKTIVFCGIDGLLMFSTQASIVKTCDRSVKIRKDGIKRNVRIYFYILLV